MGPGAKRRGPRGRTYAPVEISAFKVPPELADEIEALRARGLYGDNESDVLRVLLSQALGLVVHRPLDRAARETGRTRDVQAGTSDAPGVDKPPAG